MDIEFDLNFLMKVEEPSKKKKISKSIDLSKVYGLDDLICTQYANK